MRPEPLSCLRSLSGESSWKELRAGMALEAAAGEVVEADDAAVVVAREHARRQRQPAARRGPGRLGVIVTACRQDGAAADREDGAKEEHEGHDLLRRSEERRVGK